MSEQAPEEPSYEAAWGRFARPVQPRVGLRAIISVPKEFYWGPFMRLVAEATGSMDAESAETFALEALKQWYERNKRRQGAATPDRVQHIRTLVPTPKSGQAQSRISADLDGVVKDEAFSRVVDVRFEATQSGKALAMREAVLEALMDAMDASKPQGAEAGDTDAPPGGASKGEPADADAVTS